MIEIECVARGYIAGSGWTGVSRARAPCAASGCHPDCARAISSRSRSFTPATKAQTGHDENVSFDHVVSLIERGPLAPPAGSDARDLHARGPLRRNQRHHHRRIPSSSSVFVGDPRDRTGCWRMKCSRRTPRDSGPRRPTTPGGAQFSFDKQYVRDYLESGSVEPSSLPLPSLPEESGGKDG